MELVLGNFWNERFWLPGNITWKDVEPGFRDGITYRNYNDLLWSIPLAIAITALRSCCIKYFFIPLGHILHIKSKKVKIPFENAVLEKMYRKCHKLPTDMELVNLKKQTDLSKREIERWWRKRRAHDRPTSLDKFGENCWRFLFYSSNFIFGLSILWNTSWMWNFIDMFRGYPKHSLDNGLWWYYNITLAFYTSQTFLHFIETRRKDFWQMFIHHILTITLIMASWTVNAVRGGSLIVFVHDIADVLLEGAKTLKYTKYDKLASTFFVAFAFVWIITRLGIFSRIVHCGIFEFPTLFPPYPIYYLLAIMNVFLLTLHIVWTYMIYQVAIKLITHKTFEDVRSSTEDESVSDHASDTKNGVIKNGNGIAKNGHVKNGSAVN
ncbi:ceramide synthase 2-like [Chironomus tepperi]|uniref:ceramide synthase 2-like n=1 Tax=Chironomus tepperi TaxID=113505 RepID=UPI00391FB789